jgi:hypothetical protein
MSLINCPECGKDVSSLAAACIHCGAPLQRAMNPVGVVTTQQTSKTYKAIQLAGALCLIVGVVSCSSGAPEKSGILFLVGICLYVGGRLGAWWNHG